MIDSQARRKSPFPSCLEDLLGTLRNRTAGRLRTVE